MIVRNAKEAPHFRFRDLAPRSGPEDGSALPPGQRVISSFIQYGGHSDHSYPRRPEPSPIEVAGVGPEVVELDLAALQDLPRVSLVADFHCVAGWTARGLRWEGVRLRDIYEALVVGRPTGAKAISHIRAVGWDGWRAALLLEDALADDVLVADRLDGAPLPAEHGGPLRLVSATQYGYKSVKNLRRIELHVDEPSDAHLSFLPRLPLKVLSMHPRARVSHEERHRILPSWAVRWLYIRVAHPTIYTLGHLSALRDRRVRASAHGEIADAMDQGSE